MGVGSEVVPEVSLKTQAASVRSCGEGSGSIFSVLSCELIRVPGPMDSVRLSRFLREASTRQTGRPARQHASNAAGKAGWLPSCRATGEVEPVR